MKKRTTTKTLACFLLFAAAAALADEVPRLDRWSRGAEEVSFPAGGFPFVLDRLIPEPNDRPVEFAARLSGLESGKAYLLILPYAADVSVSFPVPADLKKPDASSVLIVASGPEASVSATAGPGAVRPESALRGAMVRPLSDAFVASVVPLGILAALAVLALLRVAYGVGLSLGPRARPDGPYLTAAGLAYLFLLLASYRYAAAGVHATVPAEYEELCRALGGILLSASAAGGIAATKPFRGAFAVFLAAALLGVFAGAAVLLSLVPGAAALAGFSALMALAFLAATVFRLATRRPGAALIAFSAAAAAAALGLSSFAYDPLLESILTCASAAPLLLATVKRRPAAAVVLPEPADTILSDQVDRVSFALTRFIPQEFLSILQKDDATELKLGDHVKKDMTIFFSDIRAFTSLSESLTAEENFKFINSYLSRVVPVVTAHGGFVDKYIGDAIMALFPNEGGADAAVQSAIEMQKRIVEYNSHRSNCGYRPLSMGIGLHTGTLMLGVVGVEGRMQSTVISDAVNLASRLESITKVFNVSLAISDETFKSLADPGAYMYRFIGKVRVRGRSDPVSVFEIFDGIDPDMQERKMRANRFFEQGMYCYYQKDFPGAMSYFRKVLEVLPEDGASTFYLDNCLSKVRI